MASNTSTTSWWARDKQKSLQSRISAIQRINDPTTNADEILAGSKWLIYLLLAFTGLLGGISYYKNFSGAFPVEAAIAMAAALTITIEWGKNYCATWTLRIPFFRGFGHVMETPANTFIFIGLLCIAGATFYMSVYNSTIGGQQLSRLLSHERNQVAFAADTKAIDDQIATLSKGIDENRKIQWKGTTTRTAQQAIASSTKAIERLQSQRESAVAQQRADWEKNQATLSENSNFTANLVLKSGGWVELLQILLILLRVSCERSLDKGNFQQEEKKSGIGFQRQPAPAFNSTTPPATPEPTPEPRRPIGFFRDKEPEKPQANAGTAAQEQPAVPPKIAVEQRSTQEQHVPVHSEHQYVPASSSAVLADVKYWEKRANQCFGRSFTQANEEKRQDNRDRCTCFCRMLQAVGVEVEVERDDSRLHLAFRHPQQYNTSQEAIRKIEEAKEELEKIGRP